MARLNGVAVASMGAGALFVYAGVRGYSIPHAIQSLIQGNAPNTGGQTTQITTPDGGSSGNTSSGSSGMGSFGSSPGAPHGGNYNHGQLMSLWIMAGGSQAGANNAACHGIQESGGDPKVTSPNPDGGTNVGLWQLDTPGGKGAGYTVDQLKDPVLNARITVRATHDGRDWSAWATPGC